MCSFLKKICTHTGTEPDPQLHGPGRDSSPIFLSLVFSLALALSLSFSLSLSLSRSPSLSSLYLSFSFSHTNTLALRSLQVLPDAFGFVRIDSGLRTYPLVWSRDPRANASACGAQVHASCAFGVCPDTVAPPPPDPSMIPRRRPFLRPHNHFSESK